MAKQQRPAGGPADVPAPPAPAPATDAAAPTIPAALADFYPASATTKQKGIFDLAQDFYAELINHPDAKVLVSDWGARPREHERFHDDAREAQRVVTLRFVMRWPARG